MKYGHQRATGCTGVLDIVAVIGYWLGTGAGPTATGSPFFDDRIPERHHLFVVEGAATLGAIARRW